MIEKSKYFSQMSYKLEALQAALTIIPLPRPQGDPSITKPRYSAEAISAARKVNELSSTYKSRPELAPIILKQLAERIEQFSGNTQFLSTLTECYVDADTGILYFPEQVIADFAIHPPTLEE
ncbi:MAG: hypothetical protein QG639_437 [Patescibacteria group bacterium]|jgi:hypothetical protein|nr:hypothetical protein [Patescibacteria group bacterium]